MPELPHPNLPSPERPGAQVAAGLGLAFLIGLAGCGGGSSATPASATPLVAPGTWAVLGSSTAAGAGASADEGWAARLAADMAPYGVTVTNLARAGLLSSQAMPAGSTLPPGRPAPDQDANIDRALSLSPKLVLLAFPSNDAVAGVPALETVQAWQAIGRQAAGAGAATMVVSTQPRAGLTAGQQAVQAETDTAAAAAFGPCFVAVREALAGHDGAPLPVYAAGDGVHLNAAGHQLIQSRVIAAIASGRCVRVSAAP